MKKIIKTKAKVKYGALQNKEGFVYMRISGKHFNDLIEEVHVFEQYYTIEENNITLILPPEAPTVIPYQQLDGMIQALLSDEKNKINSDKIEEAFLIGALQIIQSKAVLGTTAADWEIIDVPSEIHKAKRI